MGPPPAPAGQRGGRRYCTVPGGCNMDQAGGARDYITQLPAARATDVGDRRLNEPRGPLGHALASARFSPRELSGSLGDMGTFLPLLLGMVAKNNLSFVSAMF